jgi:hypothetical protein
MSSDVLIPITEDIQGILDALKKVLMKVPMRFLSVFLSHTNSIRFQRKIKGILNSPYGRYTKEIIASLKI